MVPYPVDEGGRVALYNTAIQLQAHGIEVHYASPRINGNDSNGFSRFVKVHLLDVDPRTTVLGAVKNIFDRLPYNIEKYFSRTALTQLKQIIQEEKIDALQIETLHMAQYGIELKQILGIPIVLREHNFESDITRRFRDYSRNPFIRLYATLQLGRILKYEASAVQQFDMVFPITPEDETKLRLIAPRMRSTVIPAGVDIKNLSFHRTHISDRVLFLMNYDWRPNRDSL